MAFHNRDRKDFNAGVMYMVLGAFFALWAKNYPMGTAVRMGPAYFPTILGWSLAALGGIIFLRSLFAHETEAPSKTHWRPLISILGSVTAFGILVGPAGLVIASAVMMLLCSFGGWDFRWKEQLINAVAMTAACTGIFYFGLGLPFKLFPWS